jgi:hypothetical protein
MLTPLSTSPQFISLLPIMVGRGSSVGIATRYGLEGPGIESGRREIFRTRPDRPWGPPSLLYNGYRSFQGVKRPGRDDHPPHLAPRLKKSIAIPLLALWAFVACYRVNVTFTLPSHYDNPRFIILSSLLHLVYSRQVFPQKSPLYISSFSVST